MPVNSGLNKVKELLSNGATEEAADLLLELAKDAEEAHYSSALMLKNQLEQLQHDVIDGILSDSDQRLYWAKITRRILELTRQIERGESPQKEEELTQPSQKTKPIALFPKWVWWVLPLVLLSGVFVFPHLFNPGGNNKTDGKQIQLPDDPNPDAQVMAMTGKLIHYKTKEPVAGALLEFNNGAFKAATQQDGTFTITFDKALNGKSNIPLIIRYRGQKMVEEVWLNEDNLKSLVWVEK